MKVLHGSESRRGGRGKRKHAGTWRMSLKPVRGSSAKKGGYPTSISNIATPSAHQSTALHDLLRQCTSHSTGAGRLVAGRFSCGCELSAGKGESPEAQAFWDAVSVSDMLCGCSRRISGARWCQTTRGSCVSACVPTSVEAVAVHACRTRQLCTLLRVLGPSGTSSSNFEQHQQAGSKQCVGRRQGRVGIGGDGWEKERESGAPSRVGRWWEGRPTLRCESWMKAERDTCFRPFLSIISCTPAVNFERALEAGGARVDARRPG